MKITAVLLLLVCLFAAVFLKVSWLIVGFLLLIVLFVLLGASSGAPEKSRTGTKEKKEVEILHPVVYEDVGGPSLYPESVQIVHRHAKDVQNPFEKLGIGVGTVGGAFARGIKKIIGED